MDLKMMLGAGSMVHVAGWPVRLQHDRAWQRMRAFIFSRDGGVCRVCGRSVR